MSDAPPASLDLTDDELLRLVESDLEPGALLGRVAACRAGLDRELAPAEQLARRLEGVRRGGPLASVSLELDLWRLAAECSAEELLRAAKGLAETPSSWTDRLVGRILEHREVHLGGLDPAVAHWLHALLSPSCPPAGHPQLATFLQSLALRPSSEALHEGLTSLAEHSRLHGRLAARLPAVRSALS